MNSITDPSVEVPRLLRRMENIEKAFIMFKRRYEHLHPEQSDGNRFYCQRVTLERIKDENWSLTIEPKGAIQVTSADLEDIDNVIDQLVTWRKANGK